MSHKESSKYYLKLHPEEFEIITNQIHGLSDIWSIARRLYKNDNGIDGDPDSNLIESIDNFRNNLLRVLKNSIIES